MFCLQTAVAVLAVVRLRDWCGHSDGPPERCRQTSFFRCCARQFLLKIDPLPRQARDKHRKSCLKRGAFSSCRQQAHRAFSRDVGHAHALLLLVRKFIKYRSILNNEDLPRQARDRHMGKVETEGVSSAATRHSSPPASSTAPRCSRASSDR